MKKESEISRHSLEEGETGFVKKGTRINSIFQKLKVLSFKDKSVGENGHRKLNSEEDEEQHISFTAEDSEAPELHEVHVYDARELDSEDPSRDYVGASTSSDENADVETRAESALPDSPERLESEKVPGRRQPIRTETEVVITDLTSNNSDNRGNEAKETIELTPVLPDFVSETDPGYLEQPTQVIEDAPEGIEEEIEEAVEAESEQSYEEKAMLDQHNPELGDETEGHEYEEPAAVSQDHEVDSGWAIHEPAEEDSADQAEDESGFVRFTAERLNSIETPYELVEALNSTGVEVKRLSKKLKYGETMRRLQAELVKLQRSVKSRGERVIILFEGMELAGKFDMIRKFTKHMDPRFVRVVSLNERSADEKSEWYFQRYTRHLPNPGEMVFFNRSWYDRGVVEPIHGLCSDEEYGNFLAQAPEFEYMLIENGYKILKFWLSVSDKGQKKRLDSVVEDPLRNWKASPFDDTYLERWANAKKYRNIMFSWTDKHYSPWMIINADKRKKARIETMRHVLSHVDYDGREDAEVSLAPDPSIVQRYHRSVLREEN